MPASLENSSVAGGLAEVSFISIPKKSNAKECSNYHTIAVISVAQMVKHLPAVRENWVQSLGWEDPLEKEMATHSSTLA